MSVVDDRRTVRDAANDVLARAADASLSDTAFLQEWYSAGLCWVHFPLGMGGLGVSRGLQAVADELRVDAGRPSSGDLNPIGAGMAAPTVAEHAQSVEAAQRWLAPLASAEEIWCQLFSEPGAGSDLAGLATSAVPDGEGWIVNGQKVWTSWAHRARWALLLARTDPDAPKHKGLTYFVIDMSQDNVETRPLRQMTGQAEFNEVYLTDARIPDAHRLGEIGNGWRVAMTTLMNERSGIGSRFLPRGGGVIADAMAIWGQYPDRQTPLLRDRLVRLWVRAEQDRLASAQSRAQASAPLGSEGSAAKIIWAELNQDTYGFCIDLIGDEVAYFPDYAAQEDPQTDPEGEIQRRFLRARANSIEGGTSEVLRNIIGERMLGLPGEPRVDLGIPWKAIPRG